MITSVILNIALAPLIKSKKFYTYFNDNIRSSWSCWISKFILPFLIFQEIETRNVQMLNSWERTFIYTYSIIVGVLWILAFVLSILLIPRVIIINVNSAKKVTRK